MIRFRRHCARGRCDHCSGALYQREDDRPESIAVRMEAYERSTLPLFSSTRVSACCLPNHDLLKRLRLVARTAMHLDVFPVTTSGLDQVPMRFNVHYTDFYQLSAFRVGRC